MKKIGSKGEFPEELMWTAVVLMAVVVIIVIAFLALVKINAPFSGKETGMAQSVEYIVISNKPYSLAAALTHYKPDDRSFLEHAIEISYSSINNAGSKKLDEYLKSFAGTYYPMQYDIRIIKDENELFDVSNLGSFYKCGDNLDGFCVSRGITYEHKYGICGVGRIEIDQGANKCSSPDKDVYACCKGGDDAANEFNTKNTGVTVVHCGSDNDGICNVRATKLTIGYGSTDNTEDFCGEGKVDYSGTDDCSQYAKDLPICCLYGDALMERNLGTGVWSKGTIPLLYKDSLAYAEVTIR